MLGWLSPLRHFVSGGSDMTSIAASRRAGSYGVRWAHRCVLVAFVFLAALGVAAAARATFYVAHTGSDAAAGTSPATAWRTVGRVNRACPAPGTTVLFQSGATFSDASLMPNC